MMKTFATAALLALVSTGAMAAALEPINVKEVTASGNQMPGPGKPRPINLTVTFDAMSNGCTDAESFAAVVTSSETQQTLTITRVRADVCEMTSHKEEVQVSMRGYIRGLPLIIKNPALVMENFVY